jgi:Zn ribbon nucleic-acid-binding protein
MRFLIAPVLVAVFVFVAAHPVLAQGHELALSINRDFGYGGLDNKIEGLFSLHATGPVDLVRVVFFMDNNLLTADTEPPFELQFSTNDYALGEHRFYALGSTAAGAELHSNEIVRVFITKEESGQQVIGLVLPLLAGVAAVVTIMLLVMTLLGRKASFSGGYGMLGGAVCPQCGLPYALSFWAPRLVAGRLQRCPRCGKWALVRRARPEDLAAAEARWRGDAGAQETGAGQAERARRQIDDSRYVD